MKYKNLPYPFILCIGIILSLLSCTKEDTLIIDNTSFKQIIDTAYSTNSRNKIDIYLPKDRNNDTKLIIFIHGGAWTGGNKEDFNFVVEKLRNLNPNIAIANMNYRYANGKDVLINHQLEDVKSAIDFLSTNTKKFNISEKIYLVGASAGAHLALTYGYKNASDKRIKAIGNYFGPTRLDSKEWYDAFNLGLNTWNKDVLYPIFGKAWEKELYSSYSPFAVLSATNNKPTISFHGALDPIVPVDHARDLHYKLGTLNIDHKYTEYPLGLHGFSESDLLDSYKKLLLFIDEH